jgi:pimeloyl-ACP methyl ester carboxylesterase
VLSGGSASSFEAIMDALFPPDARAQAVKCFRREMFAPADYGRVSVDAEVAAAQDRAMSAWWRDNAAADALARLHVPALVVVGEQDAVLSPRNADVLVKLLPDATLHVVLHGGHALMYQTPRRLADAIAHFVAKTHRNESRRSS